MICLSSYIILVWLQVLIVPNDASKILGVFTVPSVSHQIVFRPLMRELAIRGHEVVVITTDPVIKTGNLTNLREIDVHDVSYDYYHENVIKHLNGTSSALDILSKLFTTYAGVFDVQMRTNEIQKLIKDEEKFDLIFTHSLVRVALVLSHVFEAPLIQMNTFGAVYPNLQTVGAPFHPIYTPTSARNRLYNLSIWEKIQAIYEEYMYSVIMSSLEEYENNVIKNLFGAITPTVKELSNNVDMLFLNVHPLWSNKQAMPPNVIYLGGLHQKKEEGLPEDLLSYIEESTDGVIYMSFGSQVRPSRLPDEQLEVFRRVFSKLPYRILWKWDEDEMMNKTDNIRIFKWSPQAELLKHPNIKLFITHGGLQSTDEALTAGVPLIAFPIFADQYYNAEKYVYYNIGLKMDIKTITEDVLEQAIKSVIADQSYRENSKLLGRLMKDEPQTSLERAVWWTEYVLRHRGAKHLRSPLANLSWSEYLILDVVAAVLLVLLFSIMIGYFLIKKIVNALIFSVSFKTKVS